jgi:ribosomal protein S18 acetylase RimI-like enzyme
MMLTVGEQETAAIPHPDDPYEGSIGAYPRRFSMEPTSPQYTITSEASTLLSDNLVAELRRFNQGKASPLWEKRPRPAESLQFYLLDAKGNLIGGIQGRTHQIPEWLEITVLWVAEEMRKQGLGRELMHMAEDEARARGCRYARLATSEYQAPGFYRKLGYREYGMLENCPREETVYYFCKELL